MRRVSLHDHEHAVIVEIEGDLDIVAGHDLRHAFSFALQSTAGPVSFDLSRVSAADDHGIAALSWCCDQAIAAQRVLSWFTCSQPLIDDLRTRSATRQWPARWAWGWADLA